MPEPPKTATGNGVHDWCLPHMRGRGSWSRLDGPCSVMPIHGVGSEMIWRLTYPPKNKFVTLRFYRLNQTWKLSKPVPLPEI